MKLFDTTNAQAWADGNERLDVLVCASGDYASPASLNREEVRGLRDAMTQWLDDPNGHVSSTRNQEMSLEICRVCSERPATHIAFRMQGSVSFACCDECDTKPLYVPNATIRRGDKGWIGGFPCVVVSADNAPSGEIVLIRQ